MSCYSQCDFLGLLAYLGTVDCSDISGVPWGIFDKVQIDILDLGDWFSRPEIGTEHSTGVVLNGFLY
jgi:hypothetical protein